MDITWEDFFRHRDYIISTQGEWIGLLDENGGYICDLPPVISYKTKQTRLSSESAEIVVSTNTGFPGTTHRIVDEVIAQDLGVMSKEGKLEPSTKATRMVCIQRADGYRQTFIIAYSVASGGYQAPDKLTLHCVDMLSLLGGLPCPADLKSWRETKFHKIDRDWVKPFQKERDLAEIKIAEVADGYSVEGDAEDTIQTLIDDSIKTVNAAMGWDRSHLTVDKHSSGNESPHVVIRVSDSSVWETISPYCLAAGVDVSVTMAFPGEETKSGEKFDHPIGVVSVQQIDKEE